MLRAKTRDTFHFDQLVIGSGFGGAVAALRFSEKGYRVGVLERGKRWAEAAFPRSNWDLRKYLWLPQLGLKGLLECTVTPKLLAMHASGVGGGSLVYANVHLIPEREVFADEAWTQVRSDWYETLLPFYGLAQRMLGVAHNTYENLADRALRQVAAQMGRANTFDTVNAAVLLGPDGAEGQQVPDPYFAGDGPDRAYCQFCGGCMLGCRHNAKNTLTKNYLYFAERNGVRIFPETQAVRIEPLPGDNGARDGSGGYAVTVERGGLLRKRRCRLRARGVTVSAGVLGTITFLLKARDRDRTLPHISSTLGQRVRTNSETLLTDSSTKGDTWQGIAITSVMKCDDETHVEVTRYPAGSDGNFAARLPLATPGSLPFSLRCLLAALANPLQTVRLFWPVGKARNTIIFLVMQSADTFVHLVSRREPWTPWRHWSVQQRPGDKPLRTSFPSAEQAARRYTEITSGIPAQFFPAVTGRPITAHAMSGVPIGKDASTGVVNDQGEVFGYKNLRVLDASIIPGNLGVNPALTILALGEYAMSQVPVGDAERAARIKPILFSEPALRSVSPLGGAGNLLEVARRQAVERPAPRA